MAATMVWESLERSLTAWDRDLAQSGAAGFWQERYGKPNSKACKQSGLD